MVQVHFGGKQGVTVDYQPSDEYLVVRTMRRNPVARAALTARGRAAVAGMETTTRFAAAGVEILRARDVSAPDARAILKDEDDLEFAGRALVDPATKTPLAYTENIFLKFQDDVATEQLTALLAGLKYGLVVKRRLDFARNAYFLGAPEQTGQNVFAIAEELLQAPEVELCHPEIVRERARKAAYPQQWHLAGAVIGGQAVDAHANVQAAWALSEGAGTVIAVIDDGVDIDHPEFDAGEKVVAPYDVTEDRSDPRPYYADDRHGTACAGVATAAGVLGACGVAPKAKLMPIRLASGLGSMDEADAFYWALRNGADVISCSWGPVDGTWWNPADPRHNLKVPLPDNTRLAIDAAATSGRAGRGCVVLFAAGNGNESVDNDGYASHETVIAVAACNDRSTRSAYSDFGDAVWCSFPSSHGEPSLTPGIWTTDRSGPLGYNDGRESLGDERGYFTNSFGGTSSACPGAAGVAALVLAANPWLTRLEVKDILKNCCDKIDPTGVQYDAQGHSPAYGWGRLNAERAVRLALGMVSPPGPMVASMDTASAGAATPKAKRTSAKKGRAKKG
jgi:subtilisin family serine protease